MRNKVIYWVINIAFISIAIVCLINLGIFSTVFSPESIPLLLLLFLLIHIFKFARMYLILLEELIPPSRFLEIYIKTTFVNSVIPFKIGELFKMYCYSIETKPSKGITAVLIEKFLDAITLLIILIPYTLIHQGDISPLIAILSAFVLLVLAAYLSFASTYKYMNRFLITRGGGRKSVFLLGVIEKARSAYTSARHTLSGRFMLLFLLSIMAWAAEMILVFVASSTPDLSIVFNYISDAFLGISNVIFSNYIYLCTIIFFILFIIVYLYKYLKKLSKRKEKVC